MATITMKDYPNMEKFWKLSSSESLVSVTSTLSNTTSVSSESCHDGDYGLYEDLEDETSTKSKNGATIAAPSSSSFAKTSKLVIYTVKNSHAHISCRSFEKKTDKTSSVHISMTGVRIVQDSSGLQAEYHVKMVIGLVEYNSWKTFDDFQDVAKACTEVSTRKNSVWSAFLATLMENKNVYRRSRGSKRLTKTLLAWEGVILERSKRNWFKHLSVSSLMAESNTLQFFLECLLFEIPDVDILIEFLA